MIVSGIGKQERPDCLSSDFEIPVEFVGVEVVLPLVLNKVAIVEDDEKHGSIVGVDFLELDEMHGDFCLGLDLSLGKLGDGVVGFLGDEDGFFDEFECHGEA
jgi:hypothetical protein